ncbi:MULTISPECIES: precorrin-3B synthase [unclassified Pseudomonas]|uniref:precorrin-3B synthase n=1 Tax=unclassified Pseudomonas TaxID=196821 RepID=UPI000BD36897|nr:precorrin-3B synthase [Pseudomonas sp. URIL14HWK12:I12]PVZ21488.1 precorrin-3B synthase [Pseudomonas sp. URIL14HWK12:I10]SNZ18628.1 precorrin-3B synthase [Pseudomonas sp. URIL14HWK12:I9]
MDPFLNEPVPPRSVRPSACPGLRRIVSARDGGICRVKLPGGVLSLDQARAVAGAAERYGNGVIEATNRCNLQLRGIVDEAVADALLAAGLGSPEPGADDVRNLMLSPLAGLAPTQLADTRPLAAQWLSWLESTPRLHALSPKFATQFDGGEPLVQCEHAHDLWLSALVLEGEPHWGLGLASSLAQGRMHLAVPLADGFRLASAVVERFLALASSQQARMREVLADIGLEAFLQGLPGRRIDLPGRTEGVGDLGAHALATPGQQALGARFELGRLTAPQLRAVAMLAEGAGSSTLHLTPWQGVLIPAVAAQVLPALRAGLQVLGLITEPHAPLAQMQACTGSPGCAKALADTKADARHLANLLEAPQAVHLTGCPRSCASAQAAPATLLAVAPGRYDLFLRDGREPGFGRLRARELTLQAAAALLNGLPRSETR